MFYSTVLFSYLREIKGRIGIKQLKHFYFIGILLFISVIFIAQFETQKYLNNQDLALLTIQQTEKLSETLKRFSYKLILFERNTTVEKEIDELKNLLYSWLSEQHKFEKEIFPHHQEHCKGYTEDLLNQDFQITFSGLESKANFILSIIETNQKKNHRKELLPFIELEEEYLRILSVHRRESQELLQRNIKSLAKTQRFYFVMTFCLLLLIFYSFHKPLLETLRGRLKEYKQKEGDSLEKIEDLQCQSQMLEDAYLELATQTKREPIQYLLFKTDLSANVISTTPYFNQLTGLRKKDLPNDVIEWIEKTNAFTKEYWIEVLNGKWSGELRFFSSKNQLIVLDAHFIRNNDEVLFIASDISYLQKSKQVRNHIIQKS